MPYSYEIGQDAGPNFSRDLARLLADAADQLQATAYTVGVGSTQPTGIITALVGTGSIVVGTEAFPNANVYNTQNALPPRFSPNAQWCANLAVINMLSQKETTAGARLFPELADGRLLNKPTDLRGGAGGGGDDGGVRRGLTQDQTRRVRDRQGRAAGMWTCGVSSSCCGSFLLLEPPPGHQRGTWRTGGEGLLVSAVVSSGSRR